jgi:hypothetical protein
MTLCSTLRSSKWRKNGIFNQNTAKKYIDHNIGTVSRKTQFFLPKLAILIADHLLLGHLLENLEATFLSSKVSLSFLVQRKRGRRGSFNQGDRIGPIFAQRVIVCSGQFFF